MKSIYQSIFILLFLLVSITLFAQETEEDKKKDGSGFAGSDQVERQLEDDNESKDAFFELGFLRPYFDFNIKKIIFKNNRFSIL